MAKNRIRFLRVLLLCVIFTLSFVQLSYTRAQAPVELVFWDTLFTQSEDLPKDQQFILQAIDKFQAENPGIKVKRVVQSNDIATYDNALRSAGIAKSGPDLATQFAGGPVLSFAPFIEPLDSYFTKEEMDPVLGWESVREDFKTDGKILAVPYGAGSYFEVLYNKDLFKKAGIPEDFTPPQTWEDFLALAQKIKDAGVQAVVIGEQEGYTGAWVMATLVGGQLGPNGFFDMRARKVPINDASMITAYENYKKLYDLGLTNKDAGSRTNQQGQELFFQGKGAIWIQGGWANRDVYDALGDKVGNFPIPTLAGSKYAGGIAGGPNVSVALMNYSQHKPEGIKFLKFLLRPEIIDLYVKLSQVEPSNHKQADPSVIQNPLLQKQAEWLKAGKTIYPFDNIMPQEINDLFYRMNAAVFIGKKTPQEGAGELQAAYDKMKK
jgi:raffinose/stachyose/melibiose transport system substrate-binding protein